MKTRIGFVSNSSSSSFVCDVSGYEASGMDLCMSDIGMVRCKNDHYFMESYALGEITQEVMLQEAKEIIERYPDSAKDYDLTDEDSLQDFIYEWGEFNYEFPIELCPVCQFSTVIARDALALALKDSGKTKEQFAEMLKRQFGTYNNFKEYLKG